MSPIMGYWYNKKGGRWPYIIGLIFLMIGSLMYSLSLDIVCLLFYFIFTVRVPNLFPPPQYMLIVARFLVGLGAGTAVVARAHVGESTDLTESTGAMAAVAAAQAIGLIGGPSFSLIFTTVNAAIGSGFYFDKYTAPGYFSAILGFLNIILVFFVFVEAPKAGTVLFFSFFQILLNNLRCLQRRTRHSRRSTEPTSKRVSRPSTPMAPTR